MATRPRAVTFGAALIVGLALLGLAGEDRRDGRGDKPGAGYDERAGWKDSFKYYGPNKLWQTWTPSQKFGRDTWLFWTGGNQKFLRLLAEQVAPLSIDLFRLLDSRRRGERFAKFGLINEPNCEKATEPDEYGLYLDHWKSDPEDYYPTVYYPNGKQVYGEPTGVLGLRKFKNPNFDSSRWDVKRYFESPGAVQPPYLIGFSCAFCHMSFDPTNPPKDPEAPRWENLAANMGNQYFREGDMFLGRGRIIFGDRSPGPNRATDPYDTVGLDASSLLFHYAVTQQPGTSETSRISYDFINNPNTINSIFYLGNRPTFTERTPDGVLRVVNHVLKDGADSVGIQMALLRVWINIGCEGRYWVDHLFNPATGQRQKPLNLDDLRLNFRADAELSEEDRARRTELRTKYGDDVGQDWAEAHRRNPHLLGYLASYTPARLANAPGGNAYLLDETKPADKKRLDNGKQLFADHCASCHSNKQPMYSLARTEAQRKHFFQTSVAAPDFLANNTLSDDVRYSVTRPYKKGQPALGTNMARALATNAVDGDIWAELSSKDYKALPPLGRVRLTHAFEDGMLVAKRPGSAPSPQTDLTLDFVPPGGGRGYYRTPSLVSMWATAPYLHNNALGDYHVVNARTGARELFPNDGRDLAKDGSPLTIDTSVEGRMKMFQDGVEKLLWPQKRRYYIKRTETDCRIIELAPLLKGLLPAALTGALFDFLEEETGRAVDAYIKEKALPPVQARVLKEAVRAAVSAELEGLRKSATPGDVAGLKDRLARLAKGKLLTLITKAVGPKHAADLEARLKGLADKVKAEGERLLAPAALMVPKGTPVNLYFNLNASSLPYAVKAQIKYNSDPRKLAEALLALSDCPDLVEDKGHTYGSELSDSDKRDLIEFLKTL
jgi:hypothetical protein